LPAKRERRTGPAPARPFFAAGRASILQSAGLKVLKRFDDGVARGEAFLAAFVLLAMILAAVVQATLFNIAERDVAWAHAALDTFSWVDAFLAKGTLWLAFLGASLAAHGDKHISVDVLTKLAPGRLAFVMKGVVGIGAGVVAFFLARVFFQAVLTSAAERPLEYEVLTSGGPAHICAASARAIAESGVARPDVFCAARWGLSMLRVPVETPESAFQLVVPVMFAIIAVRLFVRGVGCFVGLARGEAEGIHGTPRV